MLVYGVNFIAGLMTAASPCVLPALPLIVGSAVREHKYGPLAVASGMVVSFTGLGLAFALAPELGIGDPDIIRNFSAILLILFGLALLSRRGQALFESLLQPFLRKICAHIGGASFKGLGGQFLVGLLLGGVWSPCVGPALGAAITLAAQAGGVIPAGIRMFAFAMGAASPLLLIAYGAKGFFNRNKSRVLLFGTHGKSIFGVISMMIGIATLTGMDKTIEAVLMAKMPRVWSDFLGQW